MTCEFDYELMNVADSLGEFLALAASLEYLATADNNPKAQALAESDKDTELKAHFAPVAEQLASNEVAIVKELNDVQGVAKDIDGYYFIDEQLARDAMRPSALFNETLANL